MNSVRFDHPELLWLLLLAVPIVWLGYRSMASLEPVRRWTAVALRLVVLVLLVLMLAGVQAVQTHSDLTVMAVVDQSESVRRFGQPVPLAGEEGDAHAVGEGNTVEGWIQRWLGAATQGRRQTDRFGMVTFDGRASVRSLPSEVATLDHGALDRPVEGTNAAAGIRTAMAAFPADTGKEMVLISDGNDTASRNGADLLAAAREAAAARVRINVVPVTYRIGNEVMVEALYAPTEAREGQTVALRAVLRATAPSDGELQLLHDDVPVDLNGDAPGVGTPVTQRDWAIEEEASDESATGAAPPAASNAPSASSLGRYVAVKQIDVPMRRGGVSEFVAVFQPASRPGGAPPADTMGLNNKAEAFTLVQGKGRVLFVDNIGGQSGQILPEALRSRDIELDVISPQELPTSLTALQRYDAVILQNVPADLVTPPQQKLLATYVNNLGGGLAMIGGQDSFGAGAWTNTPIDRILPVNCEIPSQTILPSGALVIVMDKSGSMAAPVGGTSRTQQELANEAAVLAIQTLYPQDIVGVIGFDYEAAWVVPINMNSDPPRTVHAVRGIQPDGGTNIYPGLEMAYKALADLNMQDAAVKHVILLTDGQSAPPPGGSWTQLVGQMMKANITMSTVGVGDGHDAALLQLLAQMGGGQYHPITNPSNLPQVFIKEAKTIRKNLIKEVPFTPQMVNTGSPVMQGIGGVPELKGLVLTGAKEDPRVFMPLLGPEGEPLFAHWQVGLGRTAAFTSDATNRWATNWLQWGGYADFWARTVRLIARPSTSREMDLVTSIEGERLHIRLDAAAEEQSGRRGPGPAGASFGNFLRVRGAVLQPDGTTREVTLEQTGPGIYEADVPAEATGNYVVSLFVDKPGATGDDARRAVFSGANRPPGEELRRFESNLPLLEEVARITGGRVLDPSQPAVAGLFSREMPFESRSVRPLWRTLLVWLFVFVLLDVACRRIAWDPAAMAAWARGRVQAVGDRLRGPDVQTEATMAALKQRRAATQERLGAAGAQAEPAAQGAATVAVPAATPPPRTRKFEAPETYEAKADFAEAVGGAKEDAAVQRAVRVAKEKAAQEGATTSRLLAAKRRAQERMDDTGENANG